MDEAIRTVILSDGRTAEVRAPRGKDLIKASEAAPGDNKFKYTCALVAEITRIDGKPCVFEDVKELLAADIDALASQAAGDFIFIERSVFAALIERGLILPELKGMTEPEILGWAAAFVELDKARKKEQGN